MKLRSVLVIVTIGVLVAGCGMYRCHGDDHPRQVGKMQDGEMMCDDAKQDGQKTSCSMEGSGRMDRMEKAPPPPTGQRRSMGY